MRRSRALARLALAAGTISVVVAGEGCGSVDVPASTLGARLFALPTVSTSPLNHFSCVTCHVVGDAGGRITPGYDLRDVAHRPSWWGGYETTLLDAMSYCMTEFMGGAALRETAPSARQLYEYLALNSPDDPAPALPLTVVESVTDLATLTGEVARGADVYGHACRVCHGEPHTGAGRLDSRASVIPEDTLATFPNAARAVLVEKVRHGRFFNIGGIMPLYSAEAIADQQIADVAAFLGL